MSNDAKYRKKPSISWWIGGICLFFCCWFFVQLAGPSPQIVASKGTTYVTDRLLSDGSPDYERHVLEVIRKDVTPENNAAVLLVQAMWPAGLLPENFDVVKTELGLESTPSASEALIPLGGEPTRSAVREWVKQTAADSKSSRPAEIAKEVDDGTNEGTSTAPAPHAAADEAFRWDEATDKLIDQATTRPWSGAQVPPLARWMEDNQRPIEMIIAASQRPKYYFPSATLLNDEKDLLLAMLLPGLECTRGGARALAATAMWHLGEGRHEKAWQHTLAMHRLARLAAQGPMLIEQLVGMSLDAQACQADFAILDDPRLPPQLARQILDDLAGLPPIGNMADSIDRMERLKALDAAFYAKTHGVNALVNTERSEGQITPSTTWLSLNWNMILADLNEWYDRVGAAARLESRDERRAAIAAIEAELENQGRTAGAPIHWLAGLLSRGERSRIIGTALQSILMPSLDGMDRAQDRNSTTFALTKTAAALAVYRAEHGSYPATLSDLVPGVLSKVPLDVYSGQPFIYKRDADGRGYLLYSVFEDGKDDGGTHFDGTIVKGEWTEQGPAANPNQGDIVIRMPQPKLVLPVPLKTID